MPTSQVLKECRKIARDLKIKYRFNSTSYYLGGEAIPISQKIFIDYNARTTDEMFLSIFFHEVAHCFNFRNKKYLAYHSIPDVKTEKQLKRKMSKHHMGLIVKTGLRAEKYTDKVGKKLMKQYYPKAKYTSWYNNELAIAQYQETLIATYRELSLDL